MTRSMCRSPATPPATSTSTTSTPMRTAGRSSSPPASTASRPLAERASFAPLWRPPFIDRLAAEDRCHLNGLAMRDGRPAFATCVAATNLAEGWREHRRDGGLVIDVASGETVAAGLSMPHSPRLHRGRLWLVQSGTGEFGHIDLATGRFEPVCFLQGFARGVALPRRPRGHRRLPPAREPHLRRPRAQRAAGPRRRRPALPPRGGQPRHRRHRAPPGDRGRRRGALRRRRPARRASARWRSASAPTRSASWSGRRRTASQARQSRRGMDATRQRVASRQRERDASVRTRGTGTDGAER